MDVHMCHTPVSGVSTVYYVDVSVFDSLRECQAVINIEATCLQVQVPLGAMGLGANLFASLLVKNEYAILDLFEDCIFCC